MKIIEDYPFWCGFWWNSSCSWVSWPSANRPYRTPSHSMYLRFFFQTSTWPELKPSQTAGLNSMSWRWIVSLWIVAETRRLAGALVLHGQWLMALGAGTLCYDGSRYHPSPNRVACIIAKLMQTTTSNLVLDEKLSWLLQYWAQELTNIHVRVS